MSRYPLFDYPPYDLALATRMAEVAEFYDLDLLHVHYAIPHSVSAMLARQMLAAAAKAAACPLSPRFTEPTSRWSDRIRSYLPITRFSIEQSDGVTAISHYLAGTHAARIRDQESHRSDLQLRELRDVLPRRRLARSAARNTLRTASASWCISPISGR